MKSMAKGVAKNSGMQKLSLIISDVSSCHIIDRAVPKNKEIARKARYALSASSRASIF
jgi:hypothetical protein